MYKLVRQFSLPVEIVRHISLPPRLSAITCFLSRLLSAKSSFLPRYPRDFVLAESLGRNQNHAERLEREPFNMYNSLTGSK